MPRKTDRVRARTLLDSADFDPLLHLIAIARHPSTPLDLQIDACRYMLPFAHPRLADFEITVESPDAQPVAINILNLLPDANARRVLEDAVLAAAQRERERRFIDETNARAIEAIEES